MASLYEAILLEDVPKEEEVRTDETLPTSLSFDENIIRDSQYNSLKEEDERLAPDALVLQNVREQLKSLEITDNFNASANAILSQITDNVIEKSHLRESLERYINDQIHERFQYEGKKEERKVTVDQISFSTKQSTPSTPASTSYSFQYDDEGKLEPVSSYSFKSNKNKFEEVFNEVKEQFSIPQTSIANEVERQIGSVLSTATDGVTTVIREVATDNFIADSIANVPGFLTSSAEEAVIQPVRTFIASVFDEISQTWNTLSGTAEYVWDTMIDEFSDFLEKPSEIIHDFFSDLREKIYSLPDSLFNLLVDSENYSFSPYESTSREEPPFSRSTLLGRELEFSNESYWDIKIEPYSFEGGSAPPSLVSSFYGEESNDYRIPITSFDMSGQTVVNTTSEVYPGTSLIFPSQVTQANSISFVLPEVIRRVTTYASSGRVNYSNYRVYDSLLDFKRRYLEYVFDGLYDPTSDPQPTLWVRDFRECAYKITIVKYSQDWRVSGRWEYLGIPEFSISPRGSSSSAVEMANLNFSIVGENYSENINQ